MTWTDEDQKAFEAEFGEFSRSLFTKTDPFLKVAKWAIERERAKVKRMEAEIDRLRDCWPVYQKAVQWADLGFASTELFREEVELLAAVREARGNAQR